MKDYLPILLKPSLSGYFRIIFHTMQSDQVTHTELKAWPKTGHVHAGRKVCVTGRQGRETRETMLQRF